MKLILKNVIAAAALSFVLPACATAPGSSPESAPSESAAEASAEIVVSWFPAEEVIRYADGTVDKRIVYTYDEDGQLLESKETDSRDRIIYRRMLSRSGNTRTEELSDNSGVVSVTISTLDDQGLVTEQVKQDHRESITSIVSYENSAGRVDRSVAGDGEGLPRLISSYIYEGDLLVSIDYLLPDGTREARFERTIEDGRIVREETILPDGSVETARVFKYEGDRVAQEIHYSWDKKTKTVRFEYDADGNVVKEFWSDRSGRESEVIERSWLSFEAVR